MVRKLDLEGVEAQLRVLADRWASVESELLHITCEETFLRRQQRRLLQSIFGAKHVEDPDAVERSPVLDVPCGQAPGGLSEKDHALTLGALNIFPDRHQVCRRS